MMNNKGQQEDSNKERIIKTRIEEWAEYMVQLEEEEIRRILEIEKYIIQDS